MNQGREQRSGGRRGYRRRIIAAALVCAALILAGVLWCRHSLNSAVQALVAESGTKLVDMRAYHEERLGEWASSVDETMGQIAASGLVRHYVAGHARDGGGGDGQDDEMESYLTDLLHTFAKSRGIAEAFILLPDGGLLLSSRPGNAPDEFQRQLCASAGRRQGITFGCLRPGFRYPFVDAAAPVMAEDAGREDAPLGYLIMTMPLTRLFRQALEPSSDARHHVDVSFVQPQETADGRVEATVALVNGILTYDEQPVTSAAAVADGVLCNTSSDNRPEGPYEMFFPTSVMDGRFRMALDSGALLGAIERERTRSLFNLSVLIVACFLLFVAVQRREAQRVEHQLGLRIQEQRFLLDSINRSIRAGMALVGADGIVRYANPDFSSVYGGHADTGGWQERHISSYLSVAATARFMKGVARVLAGDRELTMEMAVGSGDSERLYRVTLFPYTGAVEGEERLEIPHCVVIFKDITVFRQRALAEKARQSSMLDVFAAVVESVDKGQRGHTRKLLGVLELLSEAMGLDETERETVTCAARMAPVGKIFVPRDLLLKKGALTAEEQAAVRRAPALTCELIRGLNFGLPVAETVRGMGERLDGSGPEGMTASGISRPARVLSVANAFCAMVSPRTYRPAMSVGKALDALAGDSGLDQGVVAALASLDRERLEAALSAAEEASRVPAFDAGSGALSAGASLAGEKKEADPLQTC